MQEILLYGLETWVILAAMERKLEGIHTEFLRYIIGKRGRRLSDGTWETHGSEGVQEAAGTQLTRTYKGRRKATVAQCVALRPLFEVCARETGC